MEPQWILLDNALETSQNHSGCYGLTLNPCSPWVFLDFSSSQSCFQAIFPKPHIQLPNQDFPNAVSACFDVQQLSFLVCSVPHSCACSPMTSFSSAVHNRNLDKFFANHIFPLSCFVFFSSSRKCETLGYWSAMFSNNNDEDWPHQAYWVYGIFEKVWHLFIYPKIPWNCRPLLPFFFFFFLWVQYLIYFLLISFGFNDYYGDDDGDDFSLLFAHPPERRGSFAVGEFHSCCELFIGKESQSRGVRDKLSCESFKVCQERHIFTKKHPFKGKIWGFNLFWSIQGVFLCFWR